MINRLGTIVWAVVKSWRKNTKAKRKRTIIIHKIYIKHIIISYGEIITVWYKVYYYTHTVQCTIVYIERRVRCRYLRNIYSHGKACVCVCLLRRRYVCTTNGERRFNIFRSPGQPENKYNFYTDINRNQKYYIIRLSNNNSSIRHSWTYWFDIAVGKWW